MNRVAREPRKYALGLALVLGLVLGGGTTPGLIPDTTSQSVVITAAPIDTSRAPRSPIPGSLWLMCMTILAAMVLQIVPLPATLLDSLRPTIVGDDVSAIIGEPALSTISLGVGHTIETLMFMVAVLALFL